MTPEHRLLSFLNEYGVGVYKTINPVLKEAFPFTNDDSEYHEFSIHARQVKDFLNEMFDNKLISLKYKYAQFGSRFNEKNRTLDDVNIVVALTPQGSDRLKKLTPTPKESLWDRFTAHKSWGFWAVVVAILSVPVPYIISTCNRSGQSETSTTQAELKSKVSTSRPSTPPDTLNKKR